MVIHELIWQRQLNDLIDFRRFLRRKYGLKLREEIHASDMISNPGTLMRIRKDLRLQILKHCIDWLATQTNCNLISIRVDKSGKSADIFESAWSALIQRFENTINNKNFPGPKNTDDKGILLPDQTDEKKLRMIVRKMRHYNPVPNTQSLFSGGRRNLIIQTIVEDPLHKNSAHSYFSQMVDVTAYFLKQLYAPNNYIRKKGARNYFNRLSPILCKVASNTHPNGIVEL
jgi:hypothetical protein